MKWGLFKTFIFATVLAVFAVAGVNYINEYDSTVFFNASPLSTDSPIVSIEGTLFVPLQNIAQKLELQANYISRQNKFIIKRLADRKEIIFQLNSEKIIIDQEEDLMNHPIYLIKDRAYVSLPDFVWLFGYFLQKTPGNQYHIVSRVNSITWQNQKLIINSKTPLNAKVDYYNSSHIVTIPNAVWSNQHQSPVIEVNDGIIKNINIKNLTQANNDIAISLETGQEIPYIIFPEENSAIISFLYQKPIAKTIPQPIPAPITKEPSEPITPPVIKQEQPIAREILRAEPIITPTPFIFTEKNIFRQGNCFVLKLPVEPDSILALENPKRLILTFKQQATARPLSFSGQQYLPLIKDLSISSNGAIDTVIKIKLGSDYKEFKQFAKNIKIYHQSEPAQKFPPDTTEPTHTAFKPTINIIETITNSVSKPATANTTQNKPTENTFTTPIISVNKVSEKTQPANQTHSSQQFKKVLNGERVIIDPGHGGEDPGAISRNGLKEKDVVLQVAKLVAEKVAAAGAVPILLRKNDEYISLQDRVDKSIKEKGDLLISLHFNSFDKQRVSGTESYYYKPKDYALAKAIHQQIIKIKKTKDNGIKQAQMYLLNHTHMPGVLLEPAYISNLKEEKLVQDPKFQQELSDAIVLGIINYLKDK